MDARSMFKSSTSTGILPAICARSEWKNVLFARHSYVYIYIVIYKFTDLVVYIYL